MITIRDCVGLCHLNQQEIKALAEHDQAPVILSLEHGECLLETEKGREMLKQYIVEGIQKATFAGNAYQVIKLKCVLEAFDTGHH